jgi:hypothetical protein
MIKKSIFIILILFILTILSINASEFRPGDYWSYQKIDGVDEYITVDNGDLHVRFKGIVLIEGDIYNETDQISFTFSPVFNYEYDQYENYTSYLGLQTYDWGGGESYTINKNANYTILEYPNFSRFEYEVSLKNLTKWNRIIFFANFTLKNKFRRIREAEYSLFYISNIQTINQYIIFYFPNKYEIINSPDNGNWEYGSMYQSFHISSEYAKNPLYFIFKDTNEMKIIELENRNIERLWNYIFAVVSAILGFSLALIYDHIKKEKILLGNTNYKQYKNHDSITIKIPKKIKLK